MGTGKLNQQGTILLIDDLPFVRKRMREVLLNSGYIIAGEAENGLEGVRLVKEIAPDLVLLDITMPKMNGLEALKRFPPATKVIMCSSLGEEKYILKAIRLGARDFIVKPFTEERLINAVENVLVR